jgi:hypothetical protein
MALRFGQTTLEYVIEEKEEHNNCQFLIRKIIKNSPLKTTKGKQSA